MRQGPAGPQTLVIELALVEVAQSKVVLTALGDAPLAGTAVKLIRMASGKGTAAMEARIRDGSTGQVLMMAADREAEKAAPVNLKDLTWYGRAHKIIRTWARQFVRAASRQPGERVQDSKPFTLQLW